MQVETKALVFSSVKYGEADLIVTCYTERFGLKSYLLRAVLRAKKSKLRASLFQPLTLLQLNAYHKDKGTLERIQDAQILVPYKTLHTQVVKTSLVMFLSEILKNSVKEEEANPELFQFLMSSLLWLDENEKIANFHLAFLLKLTGHLGFYPDFIHCEWPYFNLMDGVFQKSPSGAFSEGGTGIEVMIQLHHCTLEDISTLAIDKKNRIETLQVLLKYYQLHVQDYRTPKSLAVLTQLFH
jgi:DNA repair protein RecO (recombination protein O)